MISIYRLFYFILKFTIKLFAPLTDQKIQAWVKLRKSDSYRCFKLDNQSDNEVFLVHAASGEIEYAKAFIRQLKIQLPSAKIVVSYSSSSAPKLFKNIHDYVAYFFPLPWDTASEVSLFLKTINPKALIIARTDLWPELIYQAHQNNIPITVISYNPSLSLSNRLMTEFFFRPVKNFFCVNSNQAAELKKILPYSNVIADGDTRFDQVFWRLSQPSLVEVVTQNKFMIWGSTWTEDEKELLQVLPWLKKHHYQIAWCPHECNPEKIESIKAILTSMNFSFELFSEFNLTEKNQINLIADVLILDKVGYLADLYRYADAAFVGGSFKSKVHSIMEPLCCGIPVLAGPYVQNNPEALRYAQIKINELPMVGICQNDQQMLNYLECIETHDLNEYKKISKTQLEKNKGLAEKQVHFVLKST